jgi:lysophospholipase L1-like esterase
VPTTLDIRRLLRAPVRSTRGGALQIPQPYNPFSPYNLSSFSNIVFLGDSVTAGRVATDGSQPGYVDLLRLAIQRQSGATRGEGIVCAYKPARFTYVGTWTNHATYGPFAGAVGTDATGGARSSVVAASTATIALVGNAFDVYYVTDATTAAFTVQIDSDTPVNVGGPTGSTVYSKVTVTPVNGLAGNHTVKITSPASGAVIFWGVEARSFSGGVRVHNISLSGTKAADTLTSPSGWMPSIAPDLTVLAFEINDYAAQLSIPTFTANVTSLITAAKLTGNVALIATNSQSTSLAIPQTSYVAALASLANSQGAVFYSDIFNRWGGTNAAGVALGFIAGDNIHPTAAGHADMALAVENAMQIPVPSARTKYGISTAPSSEYDMSTLGDYGYGAGGAIASVPDSYTPNLNPLVLQSGGAAADFTTFAPGNAKFTAVGNLYNNVWDFTKNVTKYTAFAAFAAADPTTTGGVIYEANNQSLGIVNQIDGLRVVCGGLTTIFGLAQRISDTAKHVVSVQYDGSQVGNAARLRLWIDAVQQTLLFTGTVPASLPNLSGAFMLGQAGSFGYTGGVAHSLVYAGASALTDADMTTVAAALTAKWGTTPALVPQVSTTFTQTDSSTVVPNADTVQAPTQRVGTWGTTSNKLYTSSGTNVAAVTYALSTPASRMQGDVVTDNASTHVHGFFLRYVDANNHCYVDFFGGNARIVTNVAGSVVARASGSTGLGAAAISLSAVVTVFNNTIAVYINGVLITQYTLAAGEITAFGSSLNAGAEFTWVSGTATAATLDNLVIY